MNALTILGNTDTPSIYLNPKGGQFEIRGNSMPENVTLFYNPVIDWLEKYAESPNPSSEFIFQMNLINTSSSKMFVDIFKKINLISEKSDVKISWYYSYGDDDIQEIGVDYKEFSKVPFEIIPINE